MADKKKIINIDSDSEEEPWIVKPKKAKIEDSSIPEEIDSPSPELKTLPKQNQPVKEGDSFAELFGPSFSSSSNIKKDKKAIERQEVKKRKNATIKEIRQSNLITKTMDESDQNQVDEVEFVIKRISQIMTILRKYSYGALSDMIKYKDSKPEHKEMLEHLESLRPKAFDKKVLMLSIDPAPTTCGVSLMDIRTKTTINCDRRAFRDKAQKSQIGFNNILTHCIDYFRFFDCEAIYVVIEEQKAGILELNKYIRNEQYFLESHSIQCAIKGIFNRNCTILAPALVKKYFGFTQLDRDKYQDEGSWKKAQYAKNKQNAVTLALNHCTQEVRNIMQQVTGGIDHNILDTIVISLYAAFSIEGISGKIWRKENGQFVEKIFKTQ